ncbi:S-adenosyl-methyltransferase, putative [Hepatocystis sp. ex Piliocolobus tephrosceles]|nr:S-adenosyl-methyltransferase, putative [Hepatocystis sp. ex Piliocolobus tephrosceles]
MILLFIIVWFFFNNYSKCFNIKKYQNYGSIISHSNNNSNTFKKKNYHLSYNFNFFIKNKAICLKEKENLFDEFYVYHTPVLLNEVIQIFKNDQINEQTGTRVIEKNINTSSHVGTASSNLNDLKKKNATDLLNLNIPLLPKETIPNKIEQSEYYIDATLGGGNHTFEILKQIPNCKVIAIDKDIESIYYSKLKLQSYIDKNRLNLIHGDYRDILHLLHNNGLPLFNNYSGILIDLGVSTHQLKCSKRGFSYKYNGILNMNMNKYTAQEYIYSNSDNIKKTYIKKNAEKNNIHTILNTYSLKKLKYIIETFGQEKKALKIAKKIIQWRKNNKKIITTYDLKDIILSTCKKNYKANNKVLSRVFQSFRIYINDELKALKELLLSTPKLLKQGKKLIVISYHSLEYEYIQKFVQNKTNIWTTIKDNPITPNENEIKLNTSARSAKMYVFQKK